MKTTRKFLAIFMIIAMIVSMGVLNAFAATITINGGASGSEYAAYKLLNATDGGSGKFAYTLNEKYTTILQTVTGKIEQADIVGAIQALDADAIRSFADNVYAAIKAAKLDADMTTGTNAFTDVEQGYYLIAEIKLGSTEGGETDTYSLVMLDTAGDEEITITTKEDTPSVEKKIVEGVNEVDYTDKGVGDIISYKITGTVSSKYADYASYYYSFEDIMSDGLTLNDSTIKVMIGGIDVTSQFTIENDEHSFSATANLKELTGVTILADTEIIVTYTATLNENAVSESTGNKNEVVLKYENNPYHKGDGDSETPDKPEKPGETPKDVNVVFTFDTIINKVDGTNNNTPLSGAGFTLSKKNENGTWTAVGAEMKNVTTFRFEKLDAGTYKLEETTVPQGYNKAADIIFTIEPTYGVKADGENVLTGLVVKNENGEIISSTEAENNAVFTASVSAGEVMADVVNNAGTELPSTGGAGTALLIGAGSALALAAAVFLVTKKRVKNAEF